MKDYLKFDKMMDEMVANGMSALDPVIRSMMRQRDKRFRALTKEEQELILIFEYETNEPLMG